MSKACGIAAHGKQTYYDILGVPPASCSKAIRSSYLQLVKKHHPDFVRDGDSVSKGVAETEFKKLSEAYSVLSHDARRSEYDRLLKMSTFSVNDSGGGDGNGMNHRSPPPRSWVKSRPPQYHTMYYNNTNNNHNSNRSSSPSWTSTNDFIRNRAQQSRSSGNSRADSFWGPGSYDRYYNYSGPYARHMNHYPYYAHYDTSETVRPDDGDEYKDMTLRTRTNTKEKLVRGSIQIIMITLGFLYSSFIFRKGESSEPASVVPLERNPMYVSGPRIRKSTKRKRSTQVQASHHKQATTTTRSSSP